MTKRHKNESFEDFKGRRKKANERRREKDRKRGRCPK